MKRREILEAKGLTLWQPMAGAIAAFGKDIENRPNRPPLSVLGKVVFIHAGLKFHQPYFDWMLEKGLTIESDIQCPDFHIHGAIVAVARVVEVVDYSSSKWWIGPVGLVLEDVTRLWSPVECKGQLGYWRVPEDVALAVAEQVAR
jgi:hypothetical protein